MQVATLYGSPPKGMVRVQVFIKAEGQIDMFMTKDELEAIYDGEDISRGSADPIVEAAGDDLLNSLEWEVDMAHECRPPKPKKTKKKKEKSR